MHSVCWLTCNKIPAHGTFCFFSHLRILDIQTNKGLGIMLSLSSLYIICYTAIEVRSIKIYIGKFVCGSL